MTEYINNVKWIEEISLEENWVEQNIMQWIILQYNRIE